MKQILIVIVVLSTLIFTGCKKEESIKEIKNPGVFFDRIEPKTFEIGDAVRLIGKNFGNERLNKYVEFYGWEIDEKEGYILWSDTLIKVIVPAVYGDDVDNGVSHINERLSNGVSYKINRGLLVDIINYFVIISLFVTLIYLYLKINKVWKRKHEREVADAQSLTGLLILIFNCMLWVLYYILVNYDTKGWMDQAIYIIEGFVFFVIGTGVFVKGQKNFGLWYLIKSAFRLERKEADYLLKKFFKPQQAEIILHIMHQIAMIDEEFDPKEQEIIQAFAKDWNIEYNFDKLEHERKQSSDNRFIRLRKIVDNYLAGDPQAEQVAQLKDMITTMIQADEKVSEEEALISSEILPMIENYLNKDKQAMQFNVLIVPQQPTHEELIHELIPNAEKLVTAGGTAYSIGSYYSPKYAEMMCGKYREYNLFTIVYPPEEALTQNLSNN